ncbi:MAG: hypothetical protein U0271_16315 [Polyangiaceae bacterium]
MRTLHAASRLVLLGLTSISMTACLSGEDLNQAEAPVLPEPTPLEVSQDGFVAPPGRYNMFNLYAEYETEGCGLTSQVYGILGPSGVRVEDCPDCLLPDVIRVGDPVPGFDSVACLPGLQGECEYQEDVAGLTLADLNYATYLCGEMVTPTVFAVEFAHLDTTEPEAPRTWITATATFTLDENGAPTAQSEWQHCIYTNDEEQCAEPE